LKQLKIAVGDQVKVFGLTGIVVGLEPDDMVRVEIRQGEYVAATIFAPAKDIER
jgi:hypothetical protein